MQRHTCHSGVRARFVRRHAHLLPQIVQLEAFSQIVRESAHGQLLQLHTGPNVLIHPIGQHFSHGQHSDACLPHHSSEFGMCCACRIQVDRPLIKGCPVQRDCTAQARLAFCSSTKQNLCIEIDEHIQAKPYGKPEARM